MSPPQDYFKEVLDNGVRVVAERIPHVKSISLGIWVQAGSRDEEERVTGVSHFAEHMFFKGTRRRSAARIAQEVDGLGGELNAFTTRENTTFYINVLDEHLEKAINILGDIFYHSVFSEGEIERERQVILQELRMVEDDPEDLIHDLHIQNIWKGNTLGRPILGNVRSISEISRRDILSHLKHYYRPERIVIAVAGNFSPRVLMARIKQVFGKSKTKPLAVNSRHNPEISQRVLIKKKPLKQVHLCLGLKGLPLDHEDRYALYALSALLGGSMSSRLFQEIREKRGLVYSIYSHFSGFQGSGLFTIYAATSQKEVEQVLSLTLRELERVRKKGISRGEFNRAIIQLKASIMLGLESTGGRMSRLAKNEIYFNRFFTVRQTLSQIEKVKKSQVQRLARELLHPKEHTLTLLGPMRSLPRKFQARLS